MLRGSDQADGFRGASFGLGGSSPSNVWIYKDAKPQPAANGPATEAGKWIACEIESRAPGITLRFDGRIITEIPAPEPAMRTVPAFYIFGEGAELAVKDLKIEIAP